MTTMHMRLDVKGALTNWPLKNFRGMFRDDAGRYMPPREAKAHLLELLAQGWDYLPFGKCEGFDPKSGCPGHEPKPTLSLSRVLHAELDQEGE